MKKIIALVLLVCLVTSIASFAMADWCRMAPKNAKKTTIKTYPSVYVYSSAKVTTWTSEKHTTGPAAGLKHKTTELTMNNGDRYLVLQTKNYDYGNTRGGLNYTSFDYYCSNKKNLLGP